MDLQYIASVAAENAVRKVLLRFTLNALASLSGPAQTAEQRAALSRQLIAAAQQVRGELLALYSPAVAGGEVARIGNTATRAVLDEFDAAFRRALQV